MEHDGVALFVGDMNIQREEPETAFANVADSFEQADMVFGNLEGLLSNVGGHKHPPTAYSSEGFIAVGMFLRPKSEDTVLPELRTDERMVSAYQSAGFSAVSLANSGGMGPGAEALFRCMEVLDRAGIGHAGAGHDQEEAHRPAIVERNGVKIAFLSYSSVSPASDKAVGEAPGLAVIRATTMYEPRANLAAVPGSPPIVHTKANAQDIARVREDVRRSKEAADVVVLSWHWGLSRNSGGELAGKIADYQVELAHAAIDAGADLIIGHHPHMLGAVEVYEGKAIFYSLGNFVFDMFAGYELPDETSTSAVVQCVIRNKQVHEVSFTPVRIPNEDSRPVLVDCTDGREIVERVIEISKPFKTQFEVAPGKVVLLAASAAGVAAKA